MLQTNFCKIWTKNDLNAAQNAKPDSKTRSQTSRHLVASEIGNTPGKTLSKSFLIGFPCTTFWPKHDAFVFLCNACGFLCFTLTFWNTWLVDGIFTKQRTGPFTKNLVFGLLLCVWTCSWRGPVLTPKTGRPKANATRSNAGSRNVAIWVHAKRSKNIPARHAQAHVVCGVLEFSTVHNFRTVTHTSRYHICISREAMFRSAGDAFWRYPYSQL